MAKRKKRETKEPQDLYKILELDETATEEQIKKAYRELAKRYHPDRNIGNPAAANLFQLVQFAYEVLSDPERRKVYDETGQADPNGGTSNDLAEVVDMIGGVLKTLLRQTLNANKELKYVNLVDMLTKHFEKNKKQVSSDIEKMEGIVVKLSDAKERFKSKSEKNILKAIVETDIESLTNKIEAGKKALNLLDRILLFLKDYEYNMEKYKDSRTHTGQYKTIIFGSGNAPFMDQLLGATSDREEVEDETDMCEDCLTTPCVCGDSDIIEDEDSEFED